MAVCYDKRNQKMTVRRAAAWLGGSTLLAAWLAAAAVPSLAPASSSDPQKYQPPVPDRTALELVAEAERLNSRLGVVVAPRPVTRNPFLFASKAQSAIQAPRAVESPASPPVPAAPRVTLLGVAEDRDGVRTAILTMGGELLFAKEDERIGGARYRITTIGADAIELEDTAESRTVRIALP